MIFVKACATMLVAWLVLAAPCTAASGDIGGTVYALSVPPSALEVGCQAPCACPVFSLPTYGSFVLVETGVDPLFTHYDVERFIASFNNGPGAVAITGSGHYRIGGEVALVQQLTLDLDIQGQPTQHFDSGLAPVSAPFPEIHIACSVHGFFCLDSVLVVDAHPTDPAAVPALPPRVIGLAAVRPNPFTSWTNISFTVDRTGPVDLSIFDSAGRRVRTLASGLFSGPGRQSVTWEGRREDGRVAPAGVYWVLMRWPSGVDQRRLVKFE